MIGRTPRHEPLLTVPILIAGLEIEAIVDCGASAPVVGPKVAKRLGVWKRRNQVSISQGDGTKLKGGNFVVNTTFSIQKFTPFSQLQPSSQPQPQPSSQPHKFALDAEVLDIGRRDIVLGLSWLKENNLVVNTPEARLENNTAGYIIPCNTYQIPTVMALNLEEELLEAN